MTPTKRGLALAALGLLVAPAMAQAQPLPRVQVWRDANCGCCGGWVEHMRAAVFPLEDNTVQSIAEVRRTLRTPSDLLSCHATLVDGFVLEGHVPAAAVKRLLATRPASIRGLAAPAMPAGSPGMEMSGVAPDTYDIIDGESGRMSFMRFRGGEPV